MSKDAVDVIYLGNDYCVSSLYNRYKLVFGFTTMHV